MLSNTIFILSWISDFAHCPSGILPPEFYPDVREEGICLCANNEYFPMITNMRESSVNGGV